MVTKFFSSSESPRLQRGEEARKRFPCPPIVFRGGLAAARGSCAHLAAGEPKEEAWVLRGKKTKVAFWRFCRQSQWRFVLLWLSPARGWLPRRFPCFGEALPGAAALGRSAVAKCSECPGAAWLSYLPSLGSHSRRPRRPRRTTRGRWHWRGDPADSRISSYMYMVGSIVTLSG